jgi:hypothetical protein
MRYLPLLLTGWLVLACNASKKTYQYPLDSRIEMSKGPCYGSCPVFKISIDGTGQATFEGTRFVKKMGPHARQLAAEETNALFQAFIDSDFWSFEDRYTAPVSDLPTTFLTFTHEGQSKKIQCYFDVPQPLLDLITQVDSVAFNGDWEPTATR